jgi:16S rRNA (uracil1498-N3)-methyltransferase
MAAFPIFFHDGPLPVNTELQLAEDTARHIVQVLRMQQGDKLQLTDGKGHLATASVGRAEKKKCSVLVEAVVFHELREPKLHLAVAFTKNVSRNEWLLEKATELGVHTIIPLSAARTEREKIRHDRWQNILVSALLQSQQYHLPRLAELTPLKNIVQQYETIPQKLVAHCMDGEPRIPLSQAMLTHKETLILIGPEGDFTAEEVALCKAQGFTAISMGDNRLRTETAAMAACAFFNMVNHA